MAMDQVVSHHVQGKRCRPHGYQNQFQMDGMAVVRKASHHL